MRRTQQNVKPVLQMILDGEPLSAAEIREMALRHVLASPNPLQREENASITEHLLDIHDLLAKNKVKTLDIEETKKLLKQNFSAALAQQLKIPVKEAETYYVWPPALPTSGRFPREFIVQLGAAIGITVAGQMSEKTSKN